MSKKKQAQKGSSGKATKKVVSIAESSNASKPIWRFDKLDRDGEFRFDLQRQEFNHQEVLSKLIDYGNMTWKEITQQTHDRKNHTKHHFLDYDGLSNAAKKRIKKLNLQEETDIIFSFALQNKLRIIGLRENNEFHIVWYDPNHEFYPSSK